MIIDWVLHKKDRSLVSLDSSYKVYAIFNAGAVE